ncbi:MAG: tRNA (adenosine(37)-N6)-dimethylallyltransferase MiaA [Clostridia bacterium]|nr:tRNA (adenosine(37)-N6)-dimethylallyltransferase MiaA [Clostridia bacterium]
MKNIIVIAGATASGKTALAINLAKRFNGEVVSADSMQIYKNMDIGTAKPDEKEMDGVPHHMLSVAEPTDSYSAKDFVEGAKKAIDDIIKRGKLPIIAGGTGMYIDLLTGRMDFDAPAGDEKVRRELEMFYEENGIDALYAVFLKEAGEYEGKIHKNDVKRVMRAIERARCGFEKSEKTTKNEYNSIWLAIDIDREKLYNKINVRVDIMLKDGLIEEVERVIVPVRDKCTTSLAGIGYKEVLMYLDGDINLEEMTELIKKRSRNYAKRQLTWFRRNKDIHWLNENNAFNEAVKIINEGIDKNENSN